MHRTSLLTLAILSCVCVSASSLNAADALVSPLSARSDLALAETAEARADEALLELKSQGGKSASSDTLAAAHERILLARAATGRAKIRLAAATHRSDPESRALRKALLAAPTPEARRAVLARHLAVSKALENETTR
jgi:hypothetical protein